MAKIMAWIMLLGTVNSRIPAPLTFMLPVLMLMGGRGLLLAKMWVGWKKSDGGMVLGEVEEQAKDWERVQSSLSLSSHAHRHSNRSQLS